MATIETGSLVPTFDQPLINANGETVDLAAAVERGPVLLSIYKSSCQASKTMFPILERFHQRHAADGLTVVGVSQDSPNVTRSFARRYGVTFPLIVEGEAFPISHAFGLFATPTVYLIERGGRVADSIMGFFREQVVQFGDAVAVAVDHASGPIITDEETGIPLFVPG